MDCYIKVNSKVTVDKNILERSWTKVRFIEILDASITAYLDVNAEMEVIWCNVCIILVCT